MREMAVMDLMLRDRRALVCGGSRGLGAAIATSLAAEGVRVALTARDTESLRSLARELHGIAIPADLSEVGGPASALDRAAASLGGLDLLVVNSGGPPPGLFSDIDEAGWASAVDQTLMSCIRLLKAGLPLLRASDVPAVLVILSSSVREPIPGLVTSNVLRPALTGLIKTLTTEWSPVRINGIAPGRIATERVASLDAKKAVDSGLSLSEVQRQSMARIPLGRYGEPCEVGRAGAFLLSPAASYINGIVLSVDGGMTKALP